MQLVIPRQSVENRTQYRDILGVIRELRELSMPQLRNHFYVLASFPAQGIALTQLQLQACCPGALGLAFLTELRTLAELNLTGSAV